MRITADLHADFHRRRIDGHFDLRGLRLVGIRAVQGHTDVLQAGIGNWQVYLRVIRGNCHGQHGAGGDILANVCVLGDNTAGVFRCAHHGAGEVDVCLCERDVRRANLCLEVGFQLVRAQREIFLGLG